MFDLIANMEPTIKAAYITAGAAILAAIISGIFLLISSKNKKNKKSGDPINIPQPTTSVEVFRNDYIHNTFIPSVDELVSTDDNDKFAEGLAKMVIDRPEGDVSLSRKEK